MTTANLVRWVLLPFGSEEHSLQCYTKNLAKITSKVPFYTVAKGNPFECTFLTINHSLHPYNGMCSLGMGEMGGDGKRAFEKMFLFSKIGNAYQN